MKVAGKLFYIPLVISILMFGCDTSQLTEEPDVAQQEQISETGNSLKDTNTNTRVTSLVLAGFTVEYQGQVFDGTSTTFNYLVTGPSNDMHFRLELPECGPADPSFIPANGTNTSNDPLVNPGVEWSPPTGAGPFEFKVTYEGFVPEGLVLVSVKANNITEVGLISGACARTFDIAGKVFTDADDDFVLDENETGIEGATVKLLDETGSLLTSMQTDDEGNYLFEDAVQGDYSVEVDPQTVAATGSDYIEPLVTLLDVTVGPDASGINFGFAPKPAVIVNDLKFNDLLTNGESVKFWKDQLKVAVSGKGGPPTYDKTQLVAFIAIIRGLGLTDAGDPYFVGMTDDEALQAALAILSVKTNKSDVDALRQQLLATEFNHAAGLGLLNDLELQEILIGWGESILVEAQAIGSSPEKGSTATSRTSGGLDDALSVFGSINKSSGGGGAGN